MATIVRNCSVEKGQYVRRGSPLGKFWTVKGHWAKKRIIFGCKVLGAAVSAAETYAWHDSEMKEINSLLCKYMRVMLRGRAKTVEDGRVRQWSNQRLHEHWRIPPFSVEVAVRRIGWLKAMLRDEANHAQALAAVFGRFLGRDVLEKDGGLCEGRIRLRWRSIGTCICLRESLGTEELYEALRKNGFQSLFVSQSEAWEALQRMDTSLLRAACWTMASGMKLEKHVKALCGRRLQCRLVLRDFVGVWNTLWATISVKKSTEMSSAAQQISWTWSSDVNFCECHYQLLSMVSFHVRDYTDCTETCCCCDVCSGPL